MKNPFKKYGHFYQGEMFRYPPLNSCSCKTKEDILRGLDRALSFIDYDPKQEYILYMSKKIFDTYFEDEPIILKNIKLKIINNKR